MSSQLSEIIKEKTLIFDGAIGTNLLEKGLSLPCPDLINFYNIDLVESLHEAYLEAGSDVIETNSFNSNTLSFENYGISQNPFECAKKAALIAKKSAEKFSTTEKPRFAAGSIGPIYTKQFSLEQNKNLLFNAFKTQVSALLEGGVDILVFETFQDTLQAKTALSAAFETADELKKEIPVILSLSGKNGKTHSKTPFEDFKEILSEFDLFAFGLNCESAQEIRNDAKIIRKISKSPLVLMPNLGIPEKVDGKYLYKKTLEEFSADMEILVRDLNPEIIGGCCGTTPEHIRYAAKAVSCR